MGSPTAFPTELLTAPPTTLPTSTPTGAPTSAPTASPTGALTSPMTSPPTTESPTDRQGNYIRFQSRLDSLCLSYETRYRQLVVKTCDNDEEEQFWLYEKNGSLINKTGTYVNKWLQVLEGTPDSNNDVFVYNTFHETLSLAANTPLVLYQSTNGVIRHANYFKDPPNDVNIMQWTILKE